MLERRVADGRHRVVAARPGVVRKLRDELLNGRVRIEPHLHGVRADERAAEDAAGQPRHIVALERLEDRDRNLGRVRDRPKRDTTPLAGFAKLGPEIGCSIHRHRC